MTKEDRIKMENTMVGASKKLMADNSFGWKLPFPVTPGSPFKIY